jgi:Uncharacterized protein conserved in bacteria
MSAPCPVFGFLVRIEIDAVATRRVSELHAALLNEVVEPRGLTCSERTDARRWAFVVRSEAGQATDADRLAVETWAQAQPEIVSVSVGTLLDFASTA